MKYKPSIPVWVSDLVFTTVILALCWLFNYDHTFFQPPQSVHTWRQTNSLSMTQMYYQYNVPFLKPEIQNQMSDDGLSGKTAGEFPVIYYLVAVFWKVFGKSEWLFRLVHLLILFAGVFSLYKLMTPLTGNSIRAGFISMLVFTSPMVIFYGPNFLPDTPALAFSFIAWFFLYRFVVARKYHSLLFSAFFFFLAISLKIIAATSFIAIGGWIIIELLLIQPGKRIFSFRFIHFIPFIISFLLVVAWYFYVDYYTGLHKGSFSFMGIWPVWKMTGEQYHRIIDALDKIYFKEFFWPPLQYFTVAIWVFMLLQIRKIPAFLGYLMVVMPIGMLIILSLWFQVLEGHDYYMISQIQVLVIVWGIFFYYLRNLKIWNHPVAFAVLILVFGMLANNGRHRHYARYEGWMNDGYKFHHEALTEIEPLFRNLKIQPDDKVISLPDYSINASLYYMNRSGYTEFASDFSQEEIFLKRIKQGAKYLVVNDTTILGKPVIQKFATHIIGNYRNVKVYDLQLFNDSLNVGGNE